MARIKTHPGKILLREHLEPMELSANKLAEALGIPQNRISDIIRGRRGVSADTAHRLARYFGTTPEFWMNMQTAHDLSIAAAENDYADIEPAQDRAALDATTDEEIHAAALADPDAKPMPEGAKARRVKDWPLPRRVRHELRLTRVEFAERYRLSIETVTAWESWKADIDPVGLALLKAIEANPDAVAEAQELETS